MAEAPRRQYAQVGDSSSTKRVRSAASLKCWLNWSRLLGVSEVSGGWPCGVRLKPQKYQPTKETGATRSNNAYFRFTRMTGIQPAIKFAMTWGNRTTRRTITAATQNNTTLNGLRFLH